MYKKFYLWLSLLSSVVLFVYLAIAGYHEVRPEWKTYRNRYKAQLIAKAPDDATRAKARSIKTGLVQFYLADLQRVDRCINCHSGTENPLMADADSPLKQHSGDYLKQHPPEQFGCTICHNGQGRATNQREAHGTGSDVHWDRPLIPFEYIQSSCAACHDLEGLKTMGGIKVVQGHTVFSEKGCLGCHKLNGVGGVMGNSLDEIGSRPAAFFPMKHVEGEKTIYTWLKEHFDDPRKVVVGSKMIGEQSDVDSVLLTTYMLSLRAEEVPRKLRRIRASASPDGTGTVAGERLYQRFCIACHATGTASVFNQVFKRTIPAIMNPAFLRAADDEFLKAVVSEGRADTLMTAWKEDAGGLTEKELDQILAYVTLQRPLERPQPIGFGRFRGNADRGERIYKVRCIACHGDKGQGGVGLSLRNPVVQNADPEFLAITIRDGRKGTFMAPFGRGGVGLRDQDIVNVVTFVRTLSDKK